MVKYNNNTRKRGDLSLKIRVKLIAALLLIVLIPMLILSVVTSSTYTNMIVENQIAFLKTGCSDKSEYINEFQRNLTSELWNFASNDSVRNFLQEPDDESADFINIAIQNSVKKSPSILDMYVLDTQGRVAAAYNKDDIGTVKDNVQELENISAKNSGISNLYPPAAGNGCYFYIVKRIYSRSNEKIGLVCQQIGLTEIADVLKISGFSNYASVMLIDSDGKYVTTASSNPKRLESISEYKEIPLHIPDAIPYYSDNPAADTITDSYDNYTVCGKAIAAGGWSVVAFYDSSDAKGAVSTKFSSVTVIIIAAAVMMSAAIIYICFRFTHPISTIIRVIKKLNMGDKDIRLDFNTDDEFGEISKAFNSMFDSIFESEQRYRTVVSMMDNVVFEINLKTYKVYVSDNFNRKFTFRAKDDTFNESFLKKMRIHKDDRKKFQEDLTTILSTSADRWEGEYRLKNIYGDFSWIRIKGKKFSDRSGVPEKVIGMMTDIDREKKGTINLMQKANFDSLTQLYNRPAFLKALNEELQQSIARRSLDALMFVDLDDFKHFNDEYGHKCGDEVLKFVADTIKELTFDRGFGGRLGGDEFVICLTGLTLIDDAGSAAREMISILNNGFVSESTGNTFNIHCSIGIAFFRENGGNANELLEAADGAMYSIKRSGKSNFAYASRNNTVL